MSDQKHSGRAKPEHLTNFNMLTRQRVPCRSAHRVHPIEDHPIGFVVGDSLTKNSNSVFSIKTSVALGFETPRCQSRQLDDTGFARSGAEVTSLVSSDVLPLGRKPTIRQEEFYQPSPSWLKPWFRRSMPIMDAHGDMVLFAVDCLGTPNSLPCNASSPQRIVFIFVHARLRTDEPKRRIPLAVPVPRARHRTDADRRASISVGHRQTPNRSKPRGFQKLICLSFYRHR